MPRMYNTMLIATMECAHQQYPIPQPNNRYADYPTRMRHGFSCPFSASSAKEKLVIDVCLVTVSPFRSTRGKTVTKQHRPSLVNAQTG